ncbi:MAG: AAA family ATPase [Sulfobacillus sp.]
MNNGLRQMTITGHTYVDMIILGNLAVICLGCLQWLSAYVREFFFGITSLVFSRFRRRMSGEVLCCLQFLENSPYRLFLRDEVIMNHRVVSDSGMHEILTELILKKQGEKLINHQNTEIQQKSWIYRWLQEDDRMIAVDSNYLDFHHNSFKKNVAYVSAGKVFTIGGGRLLKLSYCGESVSASLISHKEKYIPEKYREYAEDIVRFLDARFQMQEKVPNVYRITFSICPSADPNLFARIERGVSRMVPGKKIRETDKHSPPEFMMEMPRGCNRLLDFENKVTIRGSLIDDFNYSNYFETTSYIRSITGKNPKNGHEYWMRRDYNLLVIYSKEKLTLTELKKEVGELACWAGSAETGEKKPQSLYRLEAASEGRATKIWKPHSLEVRSFSTIYLPQKTLLDIRNEMDSFASMQTIYDSLQISYRKGILFYGPPGTGKTSLVKCLAYEYQLPIYVFDLNDEYINDETIIDTLNAIGNDGNKIILFEDVDAAFADKEQVLREGRTTIDRNPLGIIEVDTESPTAAAGKSVDAIEILSEGKLPDSAALRNHSCLSERRTKFLTYSGLLNALDGVFSNQRGIVTIMTTNYRERLGQAFLRPGRIDCQFELAECNDEQIAEMCRNFVGYAIELEGQNDLQSKSMSAERLATLSPQIESFVQELVDGSGKSKIRPCELQAYFLRHLRCVQEIFDNVHELHRNSAPSFDHDP